MYIFQAVQFIYSLYPGRTVYIFHAVQFIYSLYSRQYSLYIPGSTVYIFQAVQFWNEVSERLQTVLDKSVGLSLDIQNKDENVCLEQRFMSSLSGDLVLEDREEVHDLILDQEEEEDEENVDDVEEGEDQIG